MRFINLFLFILCVSHTFGQKSITPKTETLVNSDYFHTYKIENFFLHTNKSIYFSGEKIWFTAYTFEDDNKSPFIETTNLHINLYDENSRLISSDLFYSNKGIANGDIRLSQQLKSGTYFLELDTNWNKNFKKGKRCKIEIINTDPTLENADADEYKIDPIEDRRHASFTIVAENNKLLANTNNTFYINATKNNMPLAVNGSIIENKTGKEITKFKTNKNGLGFFNLFCEPSKSYSAIIDDFSGSIPIQASLKEGFIINKPYRNYSTDLVSFIIKTNEASLEKLEHDNFSIALHKNGILKSLTPLNLIKDKKEYLIHFSKEELSKGINTITLINEKNSIIAERHFYKDTIRTIDINIESTKQTEDYLDLNLKTLNTNEIAHLSIAVLHEDSQVGTSKENMINGLIFLNQPHSIPLNQENLNKNEIDALLQTQINSTFFPYKSMNKEDLLFDFETGLVINGSVNSSIEDLDGYKVMLTSQENNLLLTTPLEKDKTFSFKDLLINHPSNYELTLLDSFGKTTKAHFFIYDKNVNYTPSKTLDIKGLKSNVHLLESSEPISITNIRPEYTPLPLLKGIETLGEVLLNSGPGKERKTEKTIQRIKKENPYLGIGFSFANVYLIDEEKDSDQSLFEYLINLQNVNVIISELGTKILVNNRNVSITNSNQFNIIIDGTPVSQQDGFDFGNFRVTEYELITVSASGFGYGLSGGGGVINLISRRGSSIKKNVSVFSQKLVTSMGFKNSSESFKEKELAYPNSDSQKAYECIDWIPHFTANPNSDNHLRIRKPKIGGVKLVINGFNYNGDFISNIIVIPKSPL